MGGQFTFRAVPRDGFQFLDPSLLIGAQIRAQRLFADLNQFGYLCVGQVVALQPQRFHLLLDAGMRMMKTLVMKRLAFFFSEVDVNHLKPPLFSPSFYRLFSRGCKSQDFTRA